LIWNISGLAEKFIYLNDDFFLVNSFRPEDFFCKEKVVLRGKWKKIGYMGRWRFDFEMYLSFLFKRAFGITRTMHLLAQKNGALAARKNKLYFWTPHVPHPMRKSTLSSFFSENADLLEKNIRPKFRNMYQFWPIALSNHLEIYQGGAVLTGDCQNMDFIAEYHSHRRIEKMKVKIVSGEVRFVCIGSLEKLDEAKRALLINTVERASLDSL
jgi:hypothetical protein